MSDGTGDILREVLEEGGRRLSKTGAGEAASTGAKRVWGWASGLLGNKAAKETEEEVGKKALAAISKETPSTWAKVRHPFASLKANPLSTLTTLAGITGVGMGINRLLSQGETVPSFDPTKLKYPTPMDDTQIEAEITNRTSGLNKVVESMKTAPLPYIPGSEIFDMSTGMVNSMGGATLAEMQRLAAAQAARGNAIKAAGAAGAGDINAIYADAANQLENSAIQGGEYGNMVPVSGEAYAAPGQMQSTGAALSDYLSKSQLINAQDQGFLAQLSDIMGPAYANQLVLQQQAARAGAESNKQKQLAQLQMQRDQAYQDALTQAALMEEETRLKLKEEAKAVAQQYIPPSQANTYANEWSGFSDAEKQQLKAMYDVNNIEEFINLRFANDFGA